MPKKEIYITEEHEVGPTRDVLRIRTKDRSLIPPRAKNIGSLCNDRCSVFHLDLSLPSIDYIKSQGGNFISLTQNPPDGAVDVKSGAGEYLQAATTTYKGTSACWGGSIYTAWRAYQNIEDAIKYLNRYFYVRADAGNRLFTQIKLNQIIGTNTISPKPDLTEGAPFDLKDLTVNTYREEKGSQISIDEKPSNRVTIKPSTDGIGSGNITIIDSQVVIHTGSPQEQSGKGDPTKTEGCTGGNGPEEPTQPISLPPESPIQSPIGPKKPKILGPVGHPPTRPFPDK